MSKAKARTTKAKAIIPVPKPSKQIYQGKNRIAVQGQPLSAGNPEYHDAHNKQRHCLDGCIKRAEKAQKNKPNINYDKMFG